MIKEIVWKWARDEVTAFRYCWGKPQSVGINGDLFAKWGRRRVDMHAWILERSKNRETLPLEPSRVNSTLTPQESPSGQAKD